MFFYLDFDGVVLVGPVELGLAHDGHLEAAGARGRRRVRVLLNSGIVSSNLLSFVKSRAHRSLVAEEEHGPGESRGQGEEEGGGQQRRRRPAPPQHTKTIQFLNNFIGALVK